MGLHLDAFFSFSWKDFVLRFATLYAEMRSVMELCRAIPALGDCYRLWAVRLCCSECRCMQCMSRECSLGTNEINTADLAPAQLLSPLHHPNKFLITGIETFKEKKKKRISTKEMYQTHPMKGLAV
jgi:hypothetical protein